MKKILCILLISWNLMQCYSAKPTSFESNKDYLKSHDLCHQRQNYTVMAPAVNDSKMAPSVQLLKMTLFYLEDSAITYNRKAKSVSEHLIKEPAINENHSEEVHNFKERIENFLEIYADCNGMEELFDLMDLYASITLEYYKLEKEKNLTVDGKIILDVLKKYDCETLNEEYISNIYVFTTHFAKKFDDIEEDLKNEEGELPGKIIQWWNTAKNVKVYQDKFLELIKFLKLYKENKFECQNQLCEIFSSVKV
ncbi:uncharacterized protein LOC119614645 [Lucilia sericata]|uniref:uncharacterized protein LOC119614645 n=1 Tax=Lucilia sericata TaxID=13632 RepID=UPI0018A81C7F|nr:uncharacterized protein LOC119614645 [Lucilia sericata]